MKIKVWEGKRTVQQCPSRCIMSGLKVLAARVVFLPALVHVIISSPMPEGGNFKLCSAPFRSNTASETHCTCATGLKLISRQNERGKGFVIMRLIRKYASTNGSLDIFKKAKMQCLTVKLRKYSIFETFKFHDKLIQ